MYLREIYRKHIAGKYINLRKNIIKTINLYTRYRKESTNMANHDQTAPELGLRSLPFSLYLALKNKTVHFQ